MKPVLVTGASGFLGWHVARQLVDRGDTVRALVRSSSKLRDLEGVERVTGDLRDRDSLARAAAGCGLVFHVAADYRLWARDPRELYESNVDGTRNMIDAARAAGVERMVYTSTVGCVGFLDGALADESTPVSIEMMQGAYKRSKFLAEQVAIEAARGGFPVVIVNPTTPVGEHDVKPTPTGKIVLDFLRGAMPAYVDTGLNLIDVRDCAEGHLIAAERGRTGERYLLGAENLTLRQILGTLASITRLPVPTVRLPWFVAYLAGVATTAVARMGGPEPRAPLDAVRMARKKMWVDCGKARRELGFEAIGSRAALERAVAWFRANGYV